MGTDPAAPRKCKARKYKVPTGKYEEDTDSDESEISEARAETENASPEDFEFPDDAARLGEADKDPDLEITPRYEDNNYSITELTDEERAELMEAAAKVITEVNPRITIKKTSLPLEKG